MPPCLKVSPPQGIVPPGGSLAFAVEFDAGAFDARVLSDAVVVGTNIPDLPPLLVPATLTVVGAPNLQVTPDRLDFGTRFTGQTTSLSFMVRISGPVALDISRIASDLPEYTPSAGSLSLPARGTAQITVSFAPTTPGDHTGTLRLESNDPDTPVLQIPLAGIAIDPPVVGAAPPALSATLVEGGQQAQTLVISNSGRSPLDFTLRVGPVSTSIAGLSACDLTEVLVNEWFSGSLASVDLRTGQVRRVATGLQGPNKGLEVTDDLSTAYVAESIRNAVSAVDLATGTRRTVSTNVGAPNGLVLDRSQTTAYVTDYQNGRLLSLDLVTGNVQVILTGFGAPNGLTIDAAGTTLYIADYLQGTLTRVDLASGSPTVVASNLGGPVDVALDASETLAYVSGVDGGRLLQVDLSSGAVTVLESGLPGPRGLKRYGNTLYVGEWDTGGLDTIDLATGNVTPVAIGINGPTGVGLMVPSSCRNSFLTLTPSSGSVPPSGSVDVQARFDSTGLLGGEYRTTIDIASNDPVTPTLVVPATLTVIGAPNISIDADHLDFGTVFLGQTRSLPLTIRNTGSATLTVGPITADTADFSASPATLAIAPRGRTTIQVTFAPGTPVPLTETLTIPSNDPDEPVQTVSLSGAGLVPPDVQVSPSDIDADLLTGGQATRTLHIENTGGSDLSFTIGVQSTGAPGVAAPRPPAAANLAALARGIDAATLAATSTSGAAETPIPQDAVRGTTVNSRLLLLTTTSVSASVERVLGELGRPYDYVLTEDFTSVDLTPYDTIIVAMDGGFVEEADVQALANAAAGNRALIILGGTNYEPYYQGVQAYLLSNQGMPGWTVSQMPHWQVVDASDPLAAGLPGSGNFASLAASYYMLHIADAAAAQAARNGDGWPILVHKSIGVGQMVYFTHSPYTEYW